MPRKVLDWEFQQATRQMDRYGDRICDHKRDTLMLYLINEMRSADQLQAENNALKAGIFAPTYAEQLREEGRAEAQERYSEVIAAAREMLNLWERVHKGAMVGRPTVNRLRKAIFPA